MSEEPKEKGPFEDAIEIVLRGTPEIIVPLIRTVADKSSFRGCKYYLPGEAGIVISTAFAEFQIQLVTGHPFPTIGIITLQELADKHTTLLTVPPRSQWGASEALEFDGDGSYFTHFLGRLFAEFQRLGFIDFREEKPPIGFRVPHREQNG